jgi:hypothetical protein
MGVPNGAPLLTTCLPWKAPAESAIEHTAHGEDAIRCMCSRAAFSRIDRVSVMHTAAAMVDLTAGSAHLLRSALLSIPPRVRVASHSRAPRCVPRVVALARAVRWPTNPNQRCSPRGHRQDRGPLVWSHSSRRPTLRLARPGSPWATRCSRLAPRVRRRVRRVETGHLRSRGAEWSPLRNADCGDCHRSHGRCAHVPRQSRWPWAPYSQEGAVALKGWTRAQLFGAVSVNGRDPCTLRAIQFAARRDARGEGRRLPRPKYHRSTSMARDGGRRSNAVSPRRRGRGGAATKSLSSAKMRALAHCGEDHLKRESERSAADVQT